MILFPSAVAFVLAKAIIKDAEGFSAKPYLCPCGVPTIGWGTTHYPNGTSVALKDAIITRTAADYFLTCTLVTFEIKMKQVTTRQPTAHQWAAMLDLTYNIGVSAFAGSTLLKKFNAGDLAGTAEQFMAWDKGHVHGQVVVLPGLEKRRAKERELFLAGDK